jgi:hypothetical protein
VEQPVKQRDLFDQLKNPPALVDKQIARRRAMSRYYQRHHDEIRLRAQVGRYRLTFDEHAAMLDRYGERCFICREAKRLVVDHDHASNRVRGLLCDRCNLHLGLYEKERDWLTQYRTRIEAHLGKTGQA